MHQIVAPLVIAGCVAAAAPLAAQPATPKPLTEWEFLDHFPDISTIETRLDADVNGDGIRDVIAVGSDGDNRLLVVLASSVKKSAVSYRPLGQMAMDPSPVGSARLAADNGILVVEDLTGGTSAIASLYRFRYDAAAKRMRLIGDDVELYSRTWAHGGIKISTNRLTGRQIRTELKLAGRGESAAYMPQKPVTATIARKPLYMEQAPNPAKTLGWGA